MTTLRWTIITVAAVIGSLTALVPTAYAQSCQSLWVERNSYYKEAGYCFKTSRAISYFGNGGCRYDNERDLPLSRATRNRIAEIVRIERSLGCN
jgi:YARHG domain